jgi:hypothetical protein
MIASRVADVPPRVRLSQCRVDLRQLDQLVCDGGGGVDLVLAGQQVVQGADGALTGAAGSDGDQLGQLVADRLTGLVGGGLDTRGQDGGLLEAEPGLGGGGAEGGERLSGFLLVATAEVLRGDDRVVDARGGGGTEVEGGLDRGEVAVGVLDVGLGQGCHDVGLAGELDAELLDLVLGVAGVLTEQADTSRGDVHDVTDVAAGQSGDRRQGVEHPLHTVLSVIGALTGVLQGDGQVGVGVGVVEGLGDSL